MHILVSSAQDEASHPSVPGVGHVGHLGQTTLRQMAAAVVPLKLESRTPALLLFGHDLA